MKQSKTITEKSKAAKQAMTAGAESVVNGKLDPVLLRQNVQKMIRANAEKLNNPKK